MASEIRFNNNFHQSFPLVWVCAHIYETFLYSILVYVRGSFQRLRYQIVILKRNVRAFLRLEVPLVLENLPLCDNDVFGNHINTLHPHVIGDCGIDLTNKTHGTKASSFCQDISRKFTKITVVIF